MSQRAAFVVGLRRHLLGSGNPWLGSAAHTVDAFVSARCPKDDDDDGLVQRTSHNLCVLLWGIGPFVGLLLVFLIVMMWMGPRGHGDDARCVAVVVALVGVTQSMMHVVTLGNHTPLSDAGMVRILTGIE